MQEHSTTPLVCPQCGKSFHVPPSHRAKRTHCSRACYDTAKSGRAWVSRGGYRFIWVDGREVQEHRWVWEQANGPIPPGYEVHHRNDNKLDNRIENLELLSKPEHGRLHYYQGGKLVRPMRHAWSSEYPCCVECGKTDRRHAAKGVCHRCYQRHRLRLIRSSGQMA